MISKDQENYKSLIAECYATDLDLISKYHQVSGLGLNACVEKEIADLQSVNTKVFKVSEGNELVGYFGKELFDGNEYLTGFFLIPKFRNKQFRTEFWSQINSHFNKPFFSGVYQKNIPANRFLTNRGASIVGQSALKDGLANLFKVGI